MRADIFGGICMALNLIFLLVPAVASVALAQQAGQVPEGPRLELIEPSFDAGLVSAGTAVSHEFVFRNPGDQDLRILKVKPGCGCTVVDFTRVVSPGREGRVTMKVYYSEKWAGKHVRQVSVIESNDPRFRRASVAIKARVQPKETK